MHTPAPTQIATNIIALRRSHELSRYELATRADLSPAYVGQLETGRIQSPSVAFAARIAAVFGVTIEQLAGIEPAKTENA